ncbi:uncharacterized protein Tco025E_10064, partial [Trypanosoma conorhini]
VNQRRRNEFIFLRRRRVTVPELMVAVGVSCDDRGRTETPNNACKLSSMSQCRWGVVRTHHAHAGKSRREHANGNSLQGVGARERQALARQGVADQNGNAAAAPAAGPVEVRVPNELRRRGMLALDLLEENDVWLMPGQTRS